jgi:propionyl-CoA synthetase
MGYADLYRRSLADPEAFWLEAAEAVDWVQAPSRALDGSGDPFFRWFPDGRLNTCYNALDRHVEAGHGDRTALIWDSAMTSARASYTFAELTAEVARCAGMLRELGVGHGDRVVIYMPMIPQTVITMLACARIGAVHSVVFGGFAPPELAARIEDARPRVVVCGSCGIEPARVVEYKPIVDKAIAMSEHKPDAVIVFQREQAPAQLRERDVDWNDAMAAAVPAAPVDVAATDPLYILYTSGTTGKPKGVVRDNGGHAVALTWSMPHLYDVRGGDMWWSASDVGWVVGHSYIVYAPLLAGATTVVYEGKPVGTPDAGAFWRVISEYGVKSLFTAPTALRAIKKADPEATQLAKYDMSKFESLYLAGERLDPETYHWASEVLGVPVIDHWWQTETGWAIAGNPRGIEPLPVKPG